MNLKKINRIEISFAKKKFYTNFFFGLLVVSLFGCYPLTGGYRGLSYKVISTKKVSFDCNLNTVFWNDLVQKKISINVIKEGKEQENQEVFKFIMDTSLKMGSFYKFSDSLFKAVRNTNITLHLNIDDLGDKMYTVQITPENWIKKELVFGFVRQYE